MKRAALGALLVSLVAGSTAMAGTGIAYGLSQGQRDDHRGEQHRPDQNRGNAGQQQQPRRDDHRGNSFQNDRRNDGRNDGRRNDGNNGRDNHWNPPHNEPRWNNGGRDDHRGNDNRRDDHRWDNNRNNYYRPDHRPNYGRDDRNWNDRARYDRRWDNGRYHWGAYYRPHGYSVRHWSRGDRLPYAYYQRSYIVDDYYDCGLRAPPYGYHWVRVDHDVVLAAIATGVVLDVIYNQFW